MESSVKSQNEQSFGAQSDTGMLSNAAATLHNNAARFTNVGNLDEAHAQGEKEASERREAQAKPVEASQGHEQEDFRDKNMMILNCESERGGQNLHSVASYS